MIINIINIKKTFFFRPFFSSVFFIVFFMKQPGRDTIPKTIINKGAFLNTNFDFLKKKGDAKIMFLNPSCVVVGVSKKPYLLFVTPKLDKINLPIDIQKNIHEVEMLVLQATSSVEPSLSNDYCSMPSWISGFSKVKSLRLDHIKLDEIAIIENLPVTHLILVNVKFDNESKIIQVIKKMKFLTTVAYGPSVPISLVNRIRNLKLKITVLTESEYYEKKLDETF